jgi:uncharacterized membrane protein YadS
LFSETIIHYSDIAAKFMIVMALTAIGLNADLRKMMKTGARPILLALVVWVVVAGISLVVQWMTGQL